jgi:DNA-binding response OmpR family regulator
MNNSRVLLIIEIGGDAQVWAYGLNKRGVDAVTATAEDALADSSLLDYCTLVVVDIDTSQDDLISFCHYLRMMFGGSILVFTYEHDERFHLQLYRAGVAECIAKPIGTALALAKIMSWLRMEPPAKDSGQWNSHHPRSRTDDRQYIV